MKSESKRNLIPQVVRMKNGETKTIFHLKKWPVMSRKQAWDIENKSPKPNSKRQKQLAKNLLA